MNSNTEQPPLIGGDEYLKCECQQCGSKIEFPAHGLNEQIICPHCELRTVLLPLEKEWPPRAAYIGFMIGVSVLAVFVSILLNRLGLAHGGFGFTGLLFPLAAAGVFAGFIGKRTGKYRVAFMIGYSVILLFLLLMSIGAPRKN